MFVLLYHNNHKMASLTSTKIIKNSLDISQMNFHNLIAYSLIVPLCYFLNMQIKLLTKNKRLPS